MFDTDALIGISEIAWSREASHLRISRVIQEGDGPFRRKNREPTMVLFQASGLRTEHEGSRLLEPEKLRNLGTVSPIHATRISCIAHRHSTFLGRTRNRASLVATRIPCNSTPVGDMSVHDKATFRVKCLLIRDRQHL